MIISFVQLIKIVISFNFFSSQKFQLSIISHETNEKGELGVAHFMIYNPYFSIILCISSHLIIHNFHTNLHYFEKHININQTNNNNNIINIMYLQHTLSISIYLFLTAIQLCNKHKAFLKCPHWNGRWTTIAIIC